MTAAALVTQLRARGVSLVAEGERLRCRPASALASAELEALRDLKPQVLALLRTQASTQTLVCYCCRGHRFWMATDGHTVCGRCHPPADLSFVARWILDDGGVGA